MINSQFLLKIAIDQPADDTVYPYNIPVIKHALRNGVDFTAPITFLVGENGSGKSTLLEAIAVAWGFNAEGGSRNFNFSTAKTHSSLHSNVRLIRGIGKPKDGYFLRAESWYNVSTNIDELDEDPFGGAQIKYSYGGESLHEYSHGESFMALIENRLGGKGFYLFDEPESALSPSKQLEMLLHIKRLLSSGSQIIIATHSPILMAYPNAQILQLNGTGAHNVSYEDTEHYALYSDFLQNHKPYIRHLLQ